LLRCRNTFVTNAKFPNRKDGLNKILHAHHLQVGCSRSSSFAVAKGAFCFVFDGDRVSPHAGSAQSSRGSNALKLAITDLHSEMLVHCKLLLARLSSLRIPALDRIATLDIEQRHHDTKATGNKPTELPHCGIQACR